MEEGIFGGGGGPVKILSKFTGSWWVLSMLVPCTFVTTSRVEQLTISAKCVSGNVAKRDVIVEIISP